MLTAKQAQAQKQPAISSSRMVHQQGATKPDVEEEYMQNCIECELSYLDDDFSRTFLIPTTPIPAAAVAFPINPVMVTRH